jgi:hypothetical protein
MFDGNHQAAVVRHTVEIGDVVEGAELALLRALSVIDVQQGEFVFPRGHRDGHAGIHSSGSEYDRLHSIGWAYSASMSE